MIVFKIDKPCSENWENMLNIPEGKFCDLCRKKVYDLDTISSVDTKELLNKNSEFCGKKTSLKPALSGLLLALTLTSTTFSKAQNKNSSTSATENIYQKEITINGTLTSSDKRELLSGEISLVTREKVYSATADKNGNFSLKFPEKVLTEYNIIRIDYTILDYNNKEFTDYKSTIFTTKELLAKQKFDINDNYMTIGGAIITDIQPPNFYYFNGKKIGKRKFEKLKKENPSYKYFVFYDEVTTQKLTKKSFVDTLYLLYSN